MSLKKIILANDLTGIGKISLASSMVIMACCRIETALLPTVLLSSHTGGFEQIASQSLTTFFQETLRQWEALAIQSDALFIGYCQDPQQLHLLLQFHQKQTKQQLFIDPIMGDNGKLYQGFTPTYVENMKAICGHADVIMPNLTEAYLLTNQTYNDTGSLADYQQLAQQVAQLGCKTVILTGVPQQQTIGVIAYDAVKKAFYQQFTPKYPYHFFGTGDLFAAIVTASLLQGLSLSNAIDLACHTLEQCIQQTLAQGRDLKYGLAFETQLDHLTHIFHTIHKGACT